MISKGADALSNAELFAILIGSVTRKKCPGISKILEKADNSLKLSTFTIHEIKIHGIGPAKQSQLLLPLKFQTSERKYKRRRTDNVVPRCTKSLLPMLETNSMRNFCLIGLNEKQSDFQRKNKYGEYGGNSG